MDNENEILNAKITSTRLGRDEEGRLSATIRLDGGGWYSIYTVPFLDTWDMVDAEYKSHTPEGYKSLIKLMQAIGVSSWEDMVDTYVRAEIEPQERKVVKIGHILLNKWFDWDEFQESKIS